MQTLTEWLAAGLDTNTCLSASGAAPLTYAGLRKLASYVEQSLNAVGIGRNDRVALVLPNGADMASSFVTVAACCTYLCSSNANSGPNRKKKSSATKPKTRNATIVSIPQKCSAVKRN